MPLYVLRKGKKARLFEKTRLADNAFKRFKGLMLESKKNFDYALIFELPAETRYGASIHMLFMRFPIDALFLDSGKKIADFAENLKPWSLNFTPKKKAKFIVEMPAGSIRRFKLEVNDRISLN